ncbi:MAG: DUF692 domain-containing protein [Myxococcota bacterium]
MPAASGIGLGLRMDLANALLEQAPPEVQWVEIHPENYLRRGGRYPAMLKRALSRFPVVTHGLTMGFGAAQPFDPHHLADLRAFLRDVGTPWHSDHLCFAEVEGTFLHDLLPLPFTEEAATTAAQRLCEARDALDIPLAVENVSYYAPCGDAAEEPDFLVEVLERADAKLLLDVNNVYVNARNHGFDPRTYIDRIPPERVVQYHVAGHAERDDGIRIDTHGAEVCPDVYDLMEHTYRRIGDRPLLLERDNRIPALEDLLGELRRLHAIRHRALAARGEAAE